MRKTDTTRLAIRKMIEMYGPIEALKLWFPQGLQRVPIVGSHSSVKVKVGSNTEK